MGRLHNLHGWGNRDVNFVSVTSFEMIRITDVAGDYLIDEDKFVSPEGLLGAL